MGKCDTDENLPFRPVRVGVIVRVIVIIYGVPNNAQWRYYVHDGFFSLNFFFFFLVPHEGFLFYDYGEINTNATRWACTACAHFMIITDHRR